MTFFLFRHLSDPVCFAFFRCHQSHVAPRMNSKVFTPNTTYQVEILRKTAHDLAIMLPRDTFAAEKANRVRRGIIRGLEEEQWNEPSYGNALPYRSPKMTGSYCVVRKCQPRVSPGRLMRMRKLLHNSGLIKHVPSEHANSRLYVRSRGTA